MIAVKFQRRRLRSMVAINPKYVSSVSERDSGIESYTVITMNTSEEFEVQESFHEVMRQLDEDVQ